MSEEQIRERIRASLDAYWLDERANGDGEMTIEDRERFRVIAKRLESLSAAQQDGARLDWLDKHMTRTWQFYVDGRYISAREDTIREAIDNAIAAIAAGTK